MIELTEAQQAKLRGDGVESKNVIAGIRPQHITLVDQGGIDAKVDVSEMMGAELHLHLDAEGNEVVAIVPITEKDPSSVKYGEVLHFTFRPELLHLFDAETEKSLTD